MTKEKEVMQSLGGETNLNWKAQFFWTSHGEILPKPQKFANPRIWVSSTWNLVVDILQQNIDYHTHYIIIVSFVDPKIPTHFLLIGLCLLQCNKLGSHQFWMDIVQGFMHMSSTMLEGTKSLLMLTQTS